MHFLELREEKGQALVEFALVLTLLVLLVAGIFDLGRAIQGYIVIANAAREGALAAGDSTLCPSGNQPAAAAAAIAEAQSSGVTLTSSNVTTSIPTCQTGYQVRVTISYRVPLVVGTVLEPIIGHNYVQLSYTVSAAIF